MRQANYVNRIDYSFFISRQARKIIKKKIKQKAQVNQIKLYQAVSKQNKKCFPYRVILARQVVPSPAPS